MATIIELTAEIVTAHASSTQMTSDDLLQDIQKVYAALQALEVGWEDVSVIEVVARPVPWTQDKSYAAFL